MNALIWFVILYWVISIGIGLYAAKYVKNSKDFALAARALPMSVVTTVLALNTAASIYKMVENAYKVTLVAAFVPLAFLACPRGLRWKC